MLLVARTDGGAPQVAEAIRAAGAGDVRVYASRGGSWERVPHEDYMETDRWDRLYGHQEYVPPDVPSIDTPPAKEADASTEERRIPIVEEEIRTGKRAAP